MKSAQMFDKNPGKSKIEEKVKTIFKWFRKLKFEFLFIIRLLYLPIVYHKNKVS